MKKFDTIIVGGGMSGMGCTRHLKKKNMEDFIIITKDIGGKIHASDDGAVNYGAFYFRSDYKNTKKFFRPTKKLQMSEMERFTGLRRHPFSSYVLRYPITCIKLLWEIYLFDYHYQRFKKRCENLSQKKALEMDPYLYRLQHISTAEYIKENKLVHLRGNLIDGVVHATGFVDDTIMNAADFLRSMLIFIHPAYEFNFLKEKLVRPVSNKIIQEEAISVDKASEGYIVNTSKERYMCKNLVMATPMEVIKKMLKKRVIFPKSNKVYINAFHVKGLLRKEYGDSKYIRMSKNSKELVMAVEPNGTYMIYSHEKNVNLKKYFTKAKIIKMQSWRPAFHLGRTFIEPKIDENLWIIGDYNICGMEDAYITGVYAANQVLKNN